MTAKLIIYILAGLLLFLCSCQKEISINPEEHPAANGIIYIDSYPTKAKIFLDGKNTGNLTPDSLIWLTEGEHKITLKLDNFKDSNFVVNITEGKKAELYADFINNPTMRGSINCRCKPEGANVYFQDSLIKEQTPLTIENLLPGKYNLQFTKTGFHSDSTTVTVKSNKIAYAEVDLIDTTQMVLYNTSNSGLPSNYINFITSEGDSVLWIATNDCGLVKYHKYKYTWTVYNSTNSSVPDCISKIKIDNNNNLWMISPDGLVKFDRINSVLYSKENSGMTSNNVSAIEFDRNGNIWIGTMDEGIVIFDGVNFTPWGNNYLLSNMWVNEIKNINNIIYIGTLNGISIFQNGKLVNHAIANLKQPFPNQDVKIIEAFKDFLCLGIAEGLANGKNIVEGGFVFRSLNNGVIRWNILYSIPGRFVITIAKQPFGNLWIGTRDNGFAEVSLPPFTIIHSYNSTNTLLKKNWISSIYIGNDNIKWIGSYGGGLLKLKM